MIQCGQKMNNKHSQLLLVFRKNPRKWNYEWSSVLKTCTALIAGIFEWICCFNDVFLIALTSTEQLFIERPLYRRFIMITHPISSNFCKKNFSAMLSALKFSIFQKQPLEVFCWNRFSKKFRKIDRKTPAAKSLF